MWLASGIGTKIMVETKLLHYAAFQQNDSHLKLNMTNFHYVSNVSKDMLDCLCQSFMDSIFITVG